jgi:hypothetical protein
LLGTSRDALTGGRLGRQGGWQEVLLLHDLLLGLLSTHLALLLLLLLSLRNCENVKF